MDSLMTLKGAVLVGYGNKALLEQTQESKGRGILERVSMNNPSEVLLDNVLFMDEDKCEKWRSQRESFIFNFIELTAKGEKDPKERPKQIIYTKERWNH